MTRRKRIAVHLVLFACVCLTLALILGARPLQAKYHRWRLRAAWEAIFSSRDSSEPMNAFKHHLARLVELDVIAVIDHRFEHPLRNGPLGAEFLRSMLENCPPSIWWILPPVEEGANTRMTIWCEHEDVREWRKFLAAKDEEFEALLRTQDDRAGKTDRTDR